MPQRRDPAAGERAAHRMGDGATRGEGVRAWRVTFIPTTALAERGVGVNVIRERLRARGQIVHAEPVTIPGGISFTFLVTSRATDFPVGLDIEGLAIEPYEPPSPLPRPTT